MNSREKQAAVANAVRRIPRLGTFGALVGIILIRQWPRLCLIVALPACLALPGCTSSWKSQDAVYEFQIEFEREGEDSPSLPEYVVLSEERVLDGDMEFYHSSSIKSASMTLVKSAHLPVVVPSMQGSTTCIPLIPLSPRSLEPEFRITIFSPGYTATTVYPLGIYNRPVRRGEVVGQWDSPGILSTGAMRTYFGCHRDVVPLEPVTFSEDAVVAELALQTLHTTYSEKAPKQAFVIQVTSLAEAISEKELDDVPTAVRKLVADAIAEQRAVDSDPDWLKDRRDRLDRRLREGLDAAYGVIEYWAR